MMRRLGKTELLVSPIALGADHMGTTIGERESFRILDAFVDAGGNVIDTANVYGKWVKGAGNASEKLLGKWLKERKRDVIIADKGAHYELSDPQRSMRLSRREIEEDLDESLLTLGLDRVDLYLLHRDDPTREIGEILETMEGFVRAGKIRYYGASNFTAERLFAAYDYAEAHGLFGFSAVSNRYSPLHDNGDEWDTTLVTVKDAEWQFHKTTGMPLIPYQATARGYFAKKASGRVSEELHRRYHNEENDRLYEKLQDFCREKHCSMQTATLLFCAKAAFQILPLTSVRRVEDVADIAAALALFRD